MDSLQGIDIVGGPGVMWVVVLVGFQEVESEGVLNDAVLQILFVEVMVHHLRKYIKSYQDKEDD